MAPHRVGASGTSFSENNIFFFLATPPSCCRRNCSSHQMTPCSSTWVLIVRAFVIVPELTVETTPPSPDDQDGMYRSPFAGPTARKAHGPVLDLQLYTQGPLEGGAYSPLTQFYHGRWSNDSRGLVGFGVTLGPFLSFARGYIYRND